MTGMLPYLALPLIPPGDVETVQLGEHRVEENQVGHVIFDEAQGQQAAVGLEHSVALLREKALEKLSNLVLVVDDQDELAGPRR